MVAIKSLLFAITVGNAVAQGDTSYSPPKYPSPWMSSEGLWAEAYKKAADFVSQLTLLEKVNLTTGTGIGAGPCLGNIAPITRLGFRGLCLLDTPNIADFVDLGSAFPAGINVGATWDRGLAYARGAAQAAEYRSQGADIVLRPSVGPIGRFPESGRYWENFSPDPFVSGELVAPTIEGMQSEGIIANAKHYLANEQEHFRLVMEAEQNGYNLTSSVSSNLDDRTMHELYLWPFANAVRAGVGSFMCSYNQINNSYGCQNSYTLNHLLKGELGFQGFVLSDYGAHHSGASAALAGLDMSMPGDIEPLSGTSFWGANLTTAILNGTVPQWRLDDMAMRIMTPYFLVGRDKNEIPVNVNSFITSEFGPEMPYIKGSPITRINEFRYHRADHKNLIREIGRSSAVLLKNNGVLPLNNPRYRLGLFGEDAVSSPFGDNGCTYRACNNGTLAAAWGSGSWSFPYLVTPESAITRYVSDNTNGSVTTVSDSHADQTIGKVARQIDVALVFVNANSGEAVATVDGNYGDRNNLTLWGGGEELIAKVTSQCANTVVIMHTVGPVLISSWHTNPNITAILWAGLPGQESGNALTDVLYGHHNPSGRLPFTLAADRADYGGTVVYEPNNGPNAPQLDLSGLGIDYRAVDARNATPLYEFGFGLSYTTFAYSDLDVSALDFAAYPPSAPPGLSAPAPTFGGPAPPDPELYAFPAANFTRYPNFLYPFLSSADPRAASADPHYGLPPASYLPPGHDSSGPQPVHPAGGAPGGHPLLWEPVLRVSATVTNTGARDGWEVVQVYVGGLGFADGAESVDGWVEPRRVLRGFEKVWVPKGETRRVEVALRRRDLSSWDTARQNWVLAPRGKVVVEVGSSSRKLPLRTEVELKEKSAGVD